MLMGGTKPVAVDTLTVFYVINMVIMLAVIVLGGTFLVSLIQHRKIHLLDPASSRARNLLIFGLGSLWIIDGFLQAQPLMVTQFVQGFLQPLLSGQPYVISAVLRFSMRLWHLHPLTWNIIAIWIQIILGIFILLGDRWRRIGLWTSIGWGLLVWVAGEGLGSLFSGGSWLLGSPGSALFYVMAAIALLLPAAWWELPQFSRVWQMMMAGLWALLALLQAWPAAGWWDRATLHTYILNQARMPQPSLISAPIYAWARLAEQYPLMSNAILVGLFLLLAIRWSVGRPSRLTWGITLIFTFLTWWLGQDFGVLGGMGTDPNSGALILLALVIYPLIPPRSA